MLIIGTILGAIQTWLLWLFLKGRPPVNATLVPVTMLIFAVIWLTAKLPDFIGNPEGMSWLAAGYVISSAISALVIMINARKSL